MNKIMIILIIIIVLLIGGIGFLGYTVYTNNNPTAAVEDTPQELEDASGGKGFKSNIDNLVLNISNSRGKLKLFKLSFAVKSSSERVEEIVTNNYEDIVDSIITLTSSRTSEELMTVSGKMLYKEELKESITSIVAENEKISGFVSKIYFKDFVIK